LGHRWPLFTLLRSTGQDLHHLPYGR
jgi:hypothetical protein